MFILSCQLFSCLWKKRWILKVILQTWVRDILLENWQNIKSLTYMGWIDNQSDKLCICFDIVLWYDNIILGAQDGQMDPRRSSRFFADCGQFAKVAISSTIFPRLLVTAVSGVQWVSSDPGPTNGPDLGHSDPQQSSLVATQCQNIKAMSF